MVEWAALQNLYNALLAAEVNHALSDITCACACSADLIPICIATIILFIDL